MGYAGRMKPSDPGDHPFLPDRIVRGLMLVVFTATTLWCAWRTRDLSAAYQGNEAMRSMLRVTWLAYLSSFLGLALQCVFSVGVFKGYRWAFLIAALVARQTLGYIEGARRPIAHWDVQAKMAFLVLVFLYCGLRLAGPLGPRLGRLLPARDVARFLDEPDSTDHPRHSGRGLTGRATGTFRELRDLL